MLNWKLGTRTTIQMNDPHGIAIRDNRLLLFILSYFIINYV
jgi:hypothetical protein